MRRILRLPIMKTAGFINKTFKKLKRLYRHNSYLVFGLCGFIWYLLRTGTKPSRASYPCQQAAAGTTIVFLQQVAVITIGASRSGLELIKRDYEKILKALLVTVPLFLMFHAYLNYQDNLLLSKLSFQSVPIMSPAEFSQAFGEYESPDDPMLIRTTEAVVSVAYDNTVTYGTVLPFDQAQNPAYDLVWQAVEQLGFGSPENPLENFIDSSDTVLITLNLISSDIGAYTNPAAVRPVIDMAILAGAQTIWVGDGGAGYAATATTLDDTGYNDLIDELQAEHPEITIAVVNLNNPKDFNYNDHWRWVYLGAYSSFAGSGYSDADLSSYATSSDYYSKTDAYGVNPGGNIQGWFAINEWVMDATVVINMPKAKVHPIAINTISIKNHVGTSMTHPTKTYISEGTGRVAHYLLGTMTTIWYSLWNDCIWRDVLDINKTVLYTDSTGVVYPTQKRKYLNILDAIQTKEEADPPGPSCHRYGPNVDTYVVLASVDPVATDAVASRIMGYDFSVIPMINNASSDLLHPVGLNDRSLIRIIGDDINENQNHVHAFAGEWDQWAVSHELPITDFTPPQISSVAISNDATNVYVDAVITDALTAYLYYEGEVVKMDSAGDDFSAILPLAEVDFYIIAQDFWFNTQHSPTYNVDINEIPVAVPTSTLQGGLEVEFDAAGSYDPEGDAIVEWEWKLGSTVISTAMQFTHSFPGYAYDPALLPGYPPYEVTLRVKSENDMWSEPVSITVDWLPGDLDGSDLVDFADFTILKVYYSLNYPPADFDNSGKVDFEDFVILKTYYGESR
ncbi:MAG: DUF362 domain-containing protein [Planctomycetes bacterium]|nr:DUF362 domain-containing protein [Planctomycetota bacterium]